MSKRYFIYSEYKSYKTSVLQIERNFSNFDYVIKKTVETNSCSGFEKERIISDFVKDKIENGYIELTERNLKEKNYILDDLLGLIAIDDDYLKFSKFIDVFSSEVIFYIEIDDERKDFNIKEHQKNLYFEFLGKQREIKSLLQKELFIYYKQKESEGWVRENLRIKEEREIWNILSIAPEITMKHENEITFSWECNWTSEYGVAVKLINWELDMVDFIRNVDM